MPENLPEPILDRVTDKIPDDCRDALRHVWDYLDGRLTPDAAEALRLHIRECSRCFEYQLFQQSYFAAMQRLRVRTGAPWHVRAKVLANLAKAG
ncbi:MAG TPA: zf-HC2 domain-containing protein [Gemmatimonadaceae bacterium]|jgi:anti-sigma factor (TIGR02949 family)|nr:zf-HC2 domain-containing protein [Gemmatimonadaceae bacterium]